MTGASKILTVSYGTFSCTLEGFDEPFNTMKAIAEYFRDLAADDRYFGAEPPTPDPAMLHQIAKREIQRRVDAKIEENGVVLRAGFADDAQDPAQTVAVPQLADAAPAAESAAAKLSRIRAASAAPAVVPAAVVPAAVIASDYSEDEHAFDDSAAETTAPEAFDEFDIAAFNDALLMDDVDQGTDDAPTESDAADAVALADSDADLPEAAVAMQPEESPLLAVSPDAQLEADLIAEADQDFDDSDDMADSIAADEALMASLTSMIDPAPVAEVTEVAEVAEDDAFDGSEDLGSFDLDAEEIETLAKVEAPAAVAAPVAADLPPARTEKLERARARVIRIRRADAMPETDAAPVAAPLAAAPVAAAPAQSLLSDELEAALQAELAALEAETLPEAPVAQAAPLAEAPAEPRKRLDDQSGDDAVSRLIAHTNSEMQGPETRRRQSAIAHLKAAVAATVAERQLNGPNADTDGDARSEAYRSDLDRVVRPQRADAPAERPSPLVLVSEQRIDRVRPAVAATTPTAVAQPAAPQIVRPRRVSSVQLAPQPAQPVIEEPVQAVQEEPVNVFTETTPKSFAEYAEDRGVNGLESLLEAAALYRAEVLQQAQFSRADLFEAVTSLPATSDVTLEDTLRSFGTLLRDGKIAKIRRGQFRLTGAADSERAAG